MKFRGVKGHCLYLQRGPEIAYGTRKWKRIFVLMLCFVGRKNIQRERHERKLAVKLDDEYNYTKRIYVSSSAVLNMASMRIQNLFL
jgi:hypothetical protein